MCSNQLDFIQFEFQAPLLDREGKTKGYYPHTDTVNYIVILFVLFVLDIPID